MAITGRGNSPYPPDDRSSLVLIRVPRRIRHEAKRYAEMLAWATTPGGEGAFRGCPRSGWPGSPLQQRLEVIWPSGMDAPTIKQIKAAFPTATVQAGLSEMVIALDHETVTMALRGRSVWGYQSVFPPK